MNSHNETYWRGRLYAAVGDTVKAKRLGLGMSLSALGKHCGCSAATIQHVEEGSAPPLHLLVRIAEQFDCTLDDLVPVLTDAEVFS